MLRTFDLFGVSQFTLYQNKDQFTTKTGGVISILIFGILMSIFVGMAVKTFNYTNITVSREDTFASDPTYYKISANRFKIAFGLSGAQSFTNYDKLTFSLEKFSNTNDFNPNISANSIPLSPCNFSDWEGLDEEINKNFNFLKLNSYLCPPANFDFQLQGKQFSQIQKNIRIVLRQCSNNQTCSMGKTFFSQFNGNLVKLKVFYINSIINPSNKNPISYYIEDILSFYLDFQKTLFVDLQFSQYQIQTDWSLMPWSEVDQLKGIKTKGSSSIKSISAFTNSSIYAFINLRKSGEGVIYKRQYQKISYVLSFVGGLLNPLLLFMSFVKIYNKFAFEMQIGFKFFRPNPESSFFPQNFNLWHFLKYGTFKFLKALNFHPKWEEVKNYCEYRAETTQQLDIYLLYQKIERFQEVCSILLESSQQIGLHLLAKKTLSQAKRNRKRYQIQDYIQDKLQKLLNKQQINQTIIDSNKNKFWDKNSPQIQQGEETFKQFCENYRRLQQESMNGCRLSAIIIQKIKASKIEDELVTILTDDQRNNAPASAHYLQTNTNLVRQSKPTF